MNANTYLANVLAAQTLGADSAELKALQERRAEVEQMLRDHFKDSSPTIRYGGSKVKGTHDPRVLRPRSRLLLPARRHHRRGDPGGHLQQRPQRRWRRSIWSSKRPRRSAKD